MHNRWRRGRFFIPGRSHQTTRRRCAGWRQAKISPHAAAHSPATVPGRPVDNRFRSGRPVGRSVGRSIGRRRDDGTKDGVHAKLHFAAAARWIPPGHRRRRRSGFSLISILFCAGRPPLEHVPCATNDDDRRSGGGPTPSYAPQWRAYASYALDQQRARPAGLTAAAIHLHARYLTAARRAPETVPTTPDKRPSRKYYIRILALKGEGVFG